MKGTSQLGKFIIETVGCEFQGGVLVGEETGEGETITLHVLVETSTSCWYIRDQ